MTQTNPNPNSTQDPQTEVTFMSHLIELRDRILRSVLVVSIIFVVLFYFANDLYVWLSHPLLKYLPEGKMVAIGVITPIFTPLKLALVVAIFIGMPYLLYQTWAFIAPGLYKHEKRLALPLLFSSIVLFYLGVVFTYYVVFPLVFQFIAGFVPGTIAHTPDIASYLDFVLKMFFAFGLTFEVPIATILLVAAGITTPEKLGEKRRYVIVGAFVMGMLLTPPDIISQVLLALPMWLLFELGLFASRILLRQRLEERAKEEREYAENMSEEEMDAELDKAIADEEQLNKRDG